MKELVIFSKELVKFNRKTLNGNYWLLAVIEE